LKIRLAAALFRLDEKAIAIALKLSLQTAGVQRSKLYIPKPDSFSAEGDTPLNY
jgi:hypothetical protein